MDYKKNVKWSIIFIGLITLAFIYKVYNPLENAYFPKCPFKELTSYKCPGCGSQRAIHYLLNFDISNAVKQNILLIISIPYLLLGFVFDIKKNLTYRMLKWRKILFGKRAIFAILFIIISYWIIRNI